MDITAGTSRTRAGRLGTWFPCMAAAGAGVLALAACGGGSGTSSATPTLTAASAPAATASSASGGAQGGTPAPSASVAPSATASGSGAASTSASASPGRSASDTTMAELQSAHIPSFCGMKPATLVKGQFPGSPENGSGGLNPDHIVAVDVNGDGAKELVATYTCVPKVVSWPQYVIAVDSSSNTVGWAWLDAHQEHGDAKSMVASGSGVKVEWTSYDGAGFDVHNHTSLITFAGGKGHLEDLTPTAERHTTMLGVQDTASFASGSGLLLCSMTDSAVVCDEAKPAFVIPGVDGDARCRIPAAVLSKGQAAKLYCDDDGDPAYPGDDQFQPRWWSTAQGDGRVQLGSSRAYTLGYGHTLQNSWASCTITASTGIACRSLSDGHGFTLGAYVHRVA